MPFDLHEALSAAVPRDVGTPDVDAAWQRARKQHRQRSLGALATILVVVIGAVFVIADDSDRRRISTPATSDLPQALLALRAGQLVELSVDGTTTRVIAGSPDDRVGEGGDLSVSPDGTTALAELPLADGVRQCADSETRTSSALFQVDLATGNAGEIELPVTAGVAIGPTFSPDGRRLAYVEYQCQPLGQPTIENIRPNALVVRDLNGNEQFRFALPYRSPDDGNHLEILNIAGWEPDGHTLLIQVQHEPTAELWRVDTQDATTAIKLPTSDDIAPFSVTPIGATGRWLADQSSYRSGRQPQIIEYDPDTGAALNTLFKWSDLPADASGTLIGSDATGRHLLLVAYLNGGPQVLYRWSEGDAQPTKVAENVTQAVWLPTAPAQSPTTTSPNPSSVPANALGLNVGLPTGWQLRSGTCPEPRAVVVVTEMQDRPLPSGCPNVPEPWVTVQRVPKDLDGIDRACGPGYADDMPFCQAIERDPGSANGPGTERRFYMGFDALVTIHRTFDEGPSDVALTFTYADPQSALVLNLDDYQFEDPIFVAHDALEQILEKGCEKVAAANARQLEAECNDLVIPDDGTFVSAELISAGGSVASAYVAVVVRSGDEDFPYRLLVEHQWDRSTLGLEFFVTSIATYDGTSPQNGCTPQERFLGSPCTTG